MTRFDAVNYISHGIAKAFVYPGRVAIFLHGLSPAGRCGKSGPSDVLARAGHLGKQLPDGAEKK
jgi:hypothetical protein